MDLKKKKGERVLPNAGTHAARLLRVIDMGTTYSEKYNSSNRYIDLTWALTNTKHVFDEEKGEQPFVVSRKFTQNIGPKAALGKILKSWIGRDPEADFDISELFDTPCLINVIHNEVTKEGETTVYANVDTVMAAPEGMEIPDLEQEPVMFDLDEFDQDLFQSLPEFMREIIAASDEYKELKAPAPKKESSNAPKKSTKKVDFLD